MPDPITINALASTGRVDVRDPNLGNTFSVLNANFSADADITVDFGVQSQGQIFGVVRSMFIDNGTNPESVEISVSGTDQFFTVPAFSIGYYTIDANAASRVRLVTVGGATDVCTVIFYNWPRDPVVWYSFGAFNTDRPIKAQGTMDEGTDVATDGFNKPVYIGGIDRATGEFRGVGVDALGRLDFSSTINVGGVYGADPMGAPPINPGFPMAVLDSTGDLVYLQLTSTGAIPIDIAVPNTGAPASVASATADTVILAANGARKGATVFNDSTQILYLLLANAVSSATNYTVQLEAGSYYEVPAGYTGAIKGLWAAVNGDARVTELT